MWNSARHTKRKFINHKGHEGTQRTLEFEVLVLGALRGHPLMWLPDWSWTAAIITEVAGTR